MQEENRCDDIHQVARSPGFYYIRYRCYIGLALLFCPSAIVLLWILAVIRVGNETILQRYKHTASGWTFLFLEC
jgi:hypothetical protein